MAFGMTWSPDNIKSKLADLDGISVLNKAGE
jgi:hypothetical protein